MDPVTGGPCQGIRNSIPELIKLGAHNEIVCLNETDATFLTNDIFPIHALGSGKGPWQYNAELIPWLLKNLDRFDVVIVHGLWLYPSYAVTKVMRLLKNQQKNKESETFHFPKIFIMPHGMLDPYFQQDQSRRLKAIRNWFYWKLIEKKVVNNADGILFTCEEELLLARKSFSPYKPKKEINVGYGIKRPPSYTSQMKESFLELCLGLKGSQYFLFLSRIHEKKGVDLLIKAYLIQLKKIRESGTPFPKLVIAGPGMDTSYGLKLRQIIGENPGLMENIFFPGLLLGDAKWGAYYGCEAFVLPSHQENFGIVVVESLSCSRPVLISNKVNIWKEIEDGGAGIVKDDNLEGTIKLFESWGNLAEKEKNSMQLKSKALFERRYTSEAAASELLQAINAQVLKNNQIIDA